MAVGCRATPPLTEDPRPWEKGPAVTAPELEAMLKPLEPTKWAGLRKGTDGRHYFVAELESEPSSDFLERQERAYQARGVLSRSVGESPHSFPRRRGYEHLIFRKGRTKPWSLYYLEIHDSDSKWLGEAPFYRQYPSPYHLDGRFFVLRLGERDLTAWKELVIVPDRDVVDLKELPFPRFPGAVVSRVGDAKGALFVTREYVVRKAGVEAVRQHYTEALRQAGSSTDNIHKDSRLHWSSGGQPIDGITRVSLDLIPPPFIAGKDVALDRVRELAPTLFEDFPDPVIGLWLSIGFEDAALADPYQPEKPLY
jgi:hypothetical protein